MSSEHWLHTLCFLFHVWSINPKWVHFEVISRQLTCDMLLFRNCLQNTGFLRPRLRRIVWSIRNQITINTKPEEMILMSVSFLKEKRVCVCAGERRAEHCSHNVISRTTSGGPHWDVIAASCNAICTAWPHLKRTRLEIFYLSYCQQSVINDRQRCIF